MTTPPPPTIQPAAGRLGVLTVGLGAVASTLIAGVELARRGQAAPIGSLTQMATIRLGRRTDKRTPLIRDFVPLANLDDIKFRTQMRIEAVITTLTAFDNAMDKYYGAMNLIEKQVKVGEADKVEDVGLGGDAHEIKDGSEIDAPVIQLVNQILVDAIKKKASDIHIEPYEHSFRIRFRMDGVLHEMLAPPKRLESAILSRLKIMSNLDIAERRLPQDGRIKLRYNNREIDFRVSTLPTIFGEKAVLRILDKEALKALAGRQTKEAAERAD